MTIDYVVRDSGVVVPQGSGSDTELKERIAELEFALEDRDWLLLGDFGASTELSRHGLQEISRLARIMYLKNPLIQRGVNVAADYIWGRSVNITAKQKELNDLVKAFLEDKRNQVEFFAQQARLQKDRELRIDGNVFFVFFIHEITGHVRLGSIPSNEIVDIVRDPNDRKKVRYYKRQWAYEELNEETGTQELKNREAYYPDWQYTPNRKTIGRLDVINQPICHVRVGGFSDWKFGVSEVYAAIDWAKAYKVFLENWSTIVAAYARFAWKVTTTGGAKGVQAAKTKIATTQNLTTTESNPPAVTGSTFISSRDATGQPTTNLEPIKTAGATTSADDARRLLLMVAAALGLPESFFGDVTGTYATAKSLDRPTELAFVNRQMLWSDVLHQILDFVTYHAVKAVEGPLRSFGTEVVNEYGESVISFNGKFDTHIDIDFPSVIEHDMKEQISAIVSGATLDGKMPSVITDMRILARMVLTVLGENDIDELLDAMYPEDEEAAATERELNKAATDLKEAINQLAERINATD